MTTHDEMAKSKAVIELELKSIQGWLDNSQPDDSPAESELYAMKEYGLKTALSALDALLNAGECFPPEPEYLTNIEDSFNNIGDAWYGGYRKARSEDTAILAKRIMELGGVIDRTIVQERRGSELFVNTKEIALAITEHILKGER